MNIARIVPYHTSPPSLCAPKKPHLSSLPTSFPAIPRIFPDVSLDLSVPFEFANLHKVWSFSPQVPLHTHLQPGSPLCLPLSLPTLSVSFTCSSLSRFFVCTRFCWRCLTSQSPSFGIVLHCLISSCFPGFLPVQHDSLHLVLARLVCDVLKPI